MNIKPYITQFKLTDLFIEELGWNRPPRAQPLQIAAGERQYTLALLAEKSGFQVFACALASDDQLPDADTRLKIERQLTPLVAEHLLVFLTPTTQFWQWARREPNAPIKLFKETFTKGSSGERLAQKLALLAFSLEEEERGISVTEVARRTKQAFYTEKVTKSFYAKFKTEHEAFLKQIKGIDDEEMRKWYASLMLNRLMFVYFIQRKGFLDGDADYLKNKLAAVKAELGANKFHSFYRSFLLRLFHEGLGAQTHSPQLIKLIGRVPYLNGGLFEVHKLEEGKAGDAIEIPDRAFKRIFEFFDEYDWHLDSRPLGNEREINPDVLGYIFEQYINNKQMGAYYTKEDITEYISKNTIIPFLLDRAAKEVAIAFKPAEQSSVWRRLQQNPDRYIYAAVRKGVIDDAGAVIELPTEIAAGLDDVSKREGWNKAAADAYALPTETWREHVARRKRCLELRGKLTNGEIHSVNDLITWNLDIRQFAQDAILQTDDAALVRAFYRAIAGRAPEKSNEHFEHGVTVLDPTCGSGAFLFAALNVLQPLYEACLDRMEAFVAEADQSGKSKSHEDFRRVLAQIEEHPNRDYFILKTIIIGNLYGVDIMEEAVEICKLRLFLKLAAQVERDETKPNYGLEPLPDIDFNIRAGNTLVGFTDRAAVEAAFAGEGQGKFDFDNHADEFNEEAEAAERGFEAFRLQQTKLHGAITPKDKAALRSRLKKLSDKLDVFLAHEYGVKTDKPLLFEAWRKSHQPFHWYTEFFGIIKNGGFDVVVGNPPYVEYRIVRSDYSLPPDHYKSEPAANLYAFCMERSAFLLSRAGWFGMIVPAGVLGLDDALDLRNLLLKKYGESYCSTYAIRPSKLFEGVDQRLCIYVGKASEQGVRSLVTTTYHHWNSEERESLFPNLRYHRSFNHRQLERIPQIRSLEASSILEKLGSKHNKTISSYYGSRQSGLLMHYHRSPRYWIRAMDFEQYFKSQTRSRSVHHFRDLHFDSVEYGKLAGAILNSSLFFFWFISVGNGRNITGTDVEKFPIGEASKPVLKETAKLFDRLMKDFKANSFVRVRQDCEFQEFRVSRSKRIIDEIDRVLARHYGFTDEELDFIINYDIKYRMGREDE
ncbi:MAG: SAM-dependent methyltransferase [Blastocatellales bacterium]